MREAESTLARLRADLDRLSLEIAFGRAVDEHAVTPQPPGSPPFHELPKLETRLATALAWTRADRIGGKNLGISTLNNPDWNILLDLYICYLRRQMPSVSSSCLASGVPPTTALRHIAILVDRGRIVRIKDTIDRRKAFLKLSDEMVAAIDRLMDEVIDSDRRYGLERMIVTRPQRIIK